ncbi:Diphthamide biosynthesis protein 2 [Thelotrema lepadinum]|nr:Diphthamide biosynthesis protein 2 [Thelotrema lepadinum]
MSELPGSAPALSTPDTHIFEASTKATLTSPQKISDEELVKKYEISRTASEIKTGGWQIIALQFPDSLLSDAPRVVEALQQTIRRAPSNPSARLDVQAQGYQELETSMNNVSLSRSNSSEEKLYILGDTSYGACCVDEVAAEHVEAEVVVHYGRACLSPTSRLPVIYVFTQQPLSYEPLLQALRETYPEKDTKIILMADIIYSSHLSSLSSLLLGEDYTSLFAPTVLHDPSSPLPNRTVPPEVTNDARALRSYHLFHIGEPPPALLLTLSSRVASIHIYPTNTNTSTPSPQALKASTTLTLRSRYALLTSLSTASTFGILVTTLSVSNYLPAISRLQSLFAAAGKKSYLFVVGKVNAAKLANFAEVDGWVVVGCWESSLVEGEGFWRPVITPFEVEVLLKGDKGRVWTGEWEGGFGRLLGNEGDDMEREVMRDEEGGADGKDEVEGEGGSGDLDDEEESEPPEFDLRTGRYVANTRPMGTGRSMQKNGVAEGEASNSLIKRANGHLAVIGNQVSPGAEFLRSQRTWRGLGSDIEIAYDESGNEPSTAIEEGRSGIARGYTHEEGN